MTRRAWRDERGSVSLELAIIAPALLLLLGALVLAGRGTRDRAGRAVRPGSRPGAEPRRRG